MIEWNKKEIQGKILVKKEVLTWKYLRWRNSSIKYSKLCQIIVHYSMNLRVLQRKRRKIFWKWDRNMKDYSQVIIFSNQLNNSWNEEEEWILHHHCSLMTANKMFHFCHHLRHSQNQQKKNFRPRRISLVSKFYQMRKKFIKNKGKWILEEVLLDCSEIWKSRNKKIQELTTLCSEIPELAHAKGYLQFDKILWQKRKSKEECQERRWWKSSKRRKWFATSMKRGTWWMKKVTTLWTKTEIMQDYLHKK